LALTALLLSAPIIVWFWQAKTAAGATFYTADQLVNLGASINTLPIPSLYHPVFDAYIAAYLYHSYLEESAIFNFGFLASCIALFGFWRARLDPRWHPLMVMTATGFILMLGMVLRFDNYFLTFEPLRPLTDSLWQLGHLVKPGVFTTALPSPPLDTAIPLPAMLLAIFLPFVEGARYFSRFGFIAGLGFFILLAFALEHVRSRILCVALTALLLFELIPEDPVLGAPFPVTPHPMFQWLSQNSAPSDGIIDLYAYVPDHLTMLGGGEVVWEAHLHGRPIVSGPGSVIPAHTQFILNWLWSHPHEFQSSELPVLLRAYRVRYVLLHMTNAYADGALTDARQNPAFRVANCAEPDGAQSMWLYSICAVELLPTRAAGSTVKFETGWSQSEDWGIWAEGTESRVRWIATSTVGYSITIAATPLCVDGQPQQAAILIEQHIVATHVWSTCEQWSESIGVPQELVQIGWNEFTIQSRNALRPIDVSLGKNGDRRNLSLAFTRLDIGMSPESDAQRPQPELFLPIIHR
jgi:hypothetical protein